MKPLPKQTTMNKTEAAYAEELRLMELSGEVRAFIFEPLRLVLAHNTKGGRNATTYTPDFLVVYDDCFEFVEVKGFWRDDAKVKIKVAAELFPWFRFRAVRYVNKRWVDESF